ncbi:MAG: SDR family oxidoreductase [Oscillospiraceae bacterium]|nr:SDR family oxidoreductase [Oscillospiraceae bacterium]
MNLDYVKRIFALDGKKAIVTGGNSGIGKGVAVSLASLGADVTILGRDNATIDEVVEQLKTINPNCDGFSVDVSDQSQLEDFFTRYYARTSNRIDILVANAGISIAKRALETTADEVNRLYDINFKGTLFCCQQVAEQMKAQMSGNIVIVTSVNALYPLPPQAIYSSTKNALEGLAECLAVDLARYGIRVNTLAPGAIETNLGRNNPNPNRNRSKVRPELPLGRVGEPEDMGDVVACIVSDAFRYMTGSTVLVDGGLKLRNV